MIRFIPGGAVVLFFPRTYIMRYALNTQCRKSSRRTGQAWLRTVFGLVLAASGALAHSVSSIYGREAVIVPAIVIGLVVFGVFLRGRARSRWEWRAAWDAYAVREVSRRSIELIPDKEILSWGGCN